MSEDEIWQTEQDGEFPQDIDDMLAIAMMGVGTYIIPSTIEGDGGYSHHLFPLNLTTASQ